MSTQKQRVVLSFLSKSAMPKIAEGDLTKLMNIQTELTKLIDTIKPILNYHKINKGSDSAADNLETRKEIEDLEDKIQKKSKEYAILMHKMYPKEPLKECYPKLDY